MALLSDAEGQPGKSRTSVCQRKPNLVGDMRDYELRKFLIRATYDIVI